MMPAFYLIYCACIHFGNISRAQRYNEIFRNDIRKAIGAHFKFYAIMPHDGIDPTTFFAENFKATVGKIYSPYSDVGGRRVFMVAIKDPDTGFFLDGTLAQDGFETLKEKIEVENAATIELLKSAFYMTEPLGLGDDPSEELMKLASDRPVVHGPMGDIATGVQIVSGVSGGLKAAVTASGWCPCPAVQCPTPESVKVLVLPRTMGGTLYRVIDGTLQRNVDGEAFGRLTGNAFESVHFPSFPCHVWRVSEI